jgi:hypothetical protein
MGLEQEIISLFKDWNLMALYRVFNFFRNVRHFLSYPCFGRPLSLKAIKYSKNIPAAAMINLFMVVF